MSLREILTNNNPLLRKTSKPVRAITSEIRKLISDMEETMRVAPGIGLAAPQVGSLHRVILADIGEGLHVLINPKVIKRSGKQTIVEGCLSVPGVEGPVTRSSGVTVKAMNLKGENITIEAKELLATVFQHEIDHLDGKLFIDRIEDPNLITYKPKTPKEEAL
ncbi:peptide deformylase [Candidatus Margulisiibacteriota bacterium]